MLPEDLNFLKGQDESPHNWGGQNKIKERERERNQNRTFAPERELYKRKASPTLGTTLTSREINQDGGEASDREDSSATILKK